MSRYTVTEHRQNRRHLIQSFPHPVPLDSKSVAVVHDVPEAAKRAELAGQRLVEFSSSAVTRARGPAFR